MSSSVTTSQMECASLEALASHPLKPLPSFAVKPFRPKLFFKGIGSLRKLDSCIQDVLRLQDRKLSGSLFRSSVRGGGHSMFELRMYVMRCAMGK